MMQEDTQACKHVWLVLAHLCQALLQHLKSLYMLLLLRLTEGGCSHCLQATWYHTVL